MAICMHSPSSTLQIAWACTSETPPGAYCEATKVAKPSNFSRSAKGLELEKDLWEEMTTLWTEKESSVGKVLA